MNKKQYLTLRWDMAYYTTLIIVIITLTGFIISEKLFLKYCSIFFLFLSFYIKNACKKQLEELA